ncbi:hypothetical protein [Lysobacter sp. FW306-1B-D06B]|uniref:SMP-30/gluconolactonase/LRE family protein n=1 Tax=Lysobacter sp. FW306-1B-D06B TaxID=3140250 RepID=UPI00314055A0
MHASNPIRRHGLWMLPWLLAWAGLAGAADTGPVLVPVEHFIDLPDGVRQPEGLAVDPATGEIFVSTFDAREPESARNNRLLRYSAQGRLLASRAFGATPLTGVEVRDGHVYVLNFGASKLQRLPVRFDADTPIQDVLSFKALTPPEPSARQIDNPDGSRDAITFGAKGFPAINGMVFDRAGNLYVSDSFQGAIYRIEKATTCAPCTVVAISRDPLLGTTGALPFGANGLAFNTDESRMYINNAGDGRVLRMDMPSGPVSVLAESVYGADGLIFHDGLLWVASNQTDTVVALDENGRVRVRAGQFQGLHDGAPRGLLFPAATAVQGEWMIVANLALPITPMKGDEWEEDVTRWTLSRFRIPPR